MTSEIDKLKHFHIENWRDTDLLILSCNYSIRLEDVTVELEEEAYEEMRNNK